MSPARDVEPVRLLLVFDDADEAGRLRAAGLDVCDFRCGLSALVHFDAGGGPFDAAVIDEDSVGLSGQALTLALRASGFRGPLVGLADDPAAAAASWRRRGCDAVVARGGDWAKDVARLLPRRGAEGHR